MADPFTIRIFVPDGDPEGVRLISRMNWTGLALVFPRTKWPDVRLRTEVQKTGVYILSGYRAETGVEDLPTIYVGQGDIVRNRIESHYVNKDFWDRAILFVSPEGGLNRPHATWLEHAWLSAQAKLDDTNSTMGIRHRSQPFRRRRRPTRKVS
jgi:hypothetical protein